MQPSRRLSHPLGNVAGSLAAPEFRIMIGALLAIPVFGFLFYQAVRVGLEPWAGVEHGLQAWEDRTGCTIVERRRCQFFRGPFTMHSSDRQFVYRVNLIDPAGESHRGYARVGSFWTGLWRPEQVEVILNEPDLESTRDPGHD